MRMFVIRRLACLIFIGVSCAASPILAQSAPASSPTASEPAIQVASRPATQPAECEPCEGPPGTLTNNWFGLGKELDKYGIAVKLGLTQIYQQNLNGGANPHNRSNLYTGTYDWQVDVDFEKLIGLKGGRMRILTEGGWSEGINDTSVGSLFGVNASAVGDHPIYVKQLWYEQSFTDKFRVRMGKVDLTGGFECKGCPAAFDGNNYANDQTSQFLNNAFINNPTIPFPDPGLGVMVHFQPVDWWYISAAVADADAVVTYSPFETAFSGPADTFSIFETGVMPTIDSPNGPLQGAYRVGFWYDPRAKERLDGNGAKSDDLGFYTSCNQFVWKENNKPDDMQGLGLFTRYGVANAAVNTVKSFWSVGGQYQGLVPSRDDDVMGFGFGRGLVSAAAGLPANNETVLEFYYNIAITPWLHVAPDIQYIFSPGGQYPDATVLGVRMQIDF